MYPLNYLFNNFLPKRPMPKLSLLQVTLHINVNINFLSIDTRRYLLFTVLSESPFHSVFSINTSDWIRSFHTKPQLTLLALSATPLRSRETESLIVGLYFHHQSFFILCPSLGIVFSPFIEILFSLSEPSHMGTDKLLFSETLKSLVYHSLYIIFLI